MGDDKNAKTFLDIKIKQLELTAKTTDSVLASAKEEAVQRHIKEIQAIADAVEKWKLEVEAEKIGAG